MAEAERIRMNGIAYSAPPRMNAERDGESRRTTVRAGSVDSATILKLSREIEAAAPRSSLPKFSETYFCVATGSPRSVSVVKTAVEAASIDHKPTSA